MSDDQEMTPEDREQLLEEQGRLRDDFQGGDKPTGKPAVSAVTEEEWARKEKERQDEDAALVALRNKPQSVAQVLATNVALCRRALDPRIILEAAKIGMDDAALQELRDKMEFWVKNVQEQRDESLQERRVRLRELGDELFPERVCGCECASTGFVFKVGDFVTKDGKRKHDVEHIKTCGCDRGEGKRAFMKTMGGQKGRRRGRKDPPEETIPF